tara:strand:+ start:179 stop:610 length:432 start_codon:yes stop_codon:yes gene_type:complete
MELWIVYAFVAAILIAARDIFTKKFSTKYSAIEHLLYYYILCGIFIILLAIYKTKFQGEKIKFIDTEDIWKFVAIAAMSAIIISPCQILSLKYCDNPGKSKAIVNLNGIIVFLMSLYLLKDVKFEMKSLLGILLAAAGVYLIL